MDAFIAGRSAGLSKSHPFLLSSQISRDVHWLIETALIRTSYMVGMASLSLLQLHLILSIAWQGVRHGGITKWSFWTGRTGWWVGMGKIRLPEDRSREHVEKV